MAEVSWIKLKVNMFDDDKIKLIQSMPDGDTMLVIWIRLIALAGKTNENGYVYLSEDIPYTEDMLATIFNKTKPQITMALSTFRSLKMLETDTKGIYLVNFSKHQSVEKMQDLKEYNRIKQKESRERRKQVLLAAEAGENVKNVNHVNDNVNDCVNDNVKNVNLDIDKDLDLDLDKEKEKEEEKKKKKKPKENKKNYSAEISTIIDYLNQVVGSNYKSITETTIKLCTKLLNDGYTIDDFKTVVDKKNAEWKDDPEWCKYLRPSTLFQSGKFENYLNQKAVARTNQVRTTPLGEKGCIYSDDELPF